MIPKLAPLLLAVLPVAWCAPRGQIPLASLTAPGVGQGSESGPARGVELVEHAEANTVGSLSKWSSKVKNDFINDLRNNNATQW